MRRRVPLLHRAALLLLATCPLIARAGTGPDNVWLRISHAVGLHAMSFRSDGQVLFTSDQLLMKSWRASDLALLATGDRNLALAFSPDGQMALRAQYSSPYDGILTDPMTGAEIRRLSGHTGTIQAAAFSADNQTVATGGDDNTIKLWKTSDGSLLRTLTGHTSSVQTLAFSPDGGTLVSGSADTKVKVWQVSSGQLLTTLSGHSSWVSRVAFAPSGLAFGSASDNGTLKIWRLSDYAVLQTLSIGSYPAFVFTADSQAVVSVAQSDDRVRMWRVTDGAVLKLVYGITGGANALALSPDGQALVVAAADATLRKYRVSDWTVVCSVEGFNRTARRIAVSPDGRTAATTTIGGGPTIIRRVRDGVRLIAIEASDPIGFVASGDTVAWTPDGQEVVCLAGTAAKLRRAVDGTVVRTFTQPTGSVAAVALSADGLILATGGTDGKVQLWSAGDGSMIRSVTAGTSVVKTLAFSPDGQTLAVGLNGDGPNSTALYTVSTGALIRSLATGTECKQVVWRPDGYQLATASAIGPQIWRVSDGGLVASIPYTAGGVAYSPDGLQLAWCGDHIGVCRAADGTVLSTTPIGMSSGLSVSFTSDGRHLIYGRDDGAVGMTGNPVSSYSWVVSSVGLGPTGKTRMLWTRSDGTANESTVNAAGVIDSNWVFGPYAGWIPVATSVGGNGKARVLWTKPDGTAAVWTLGAGGAIESGYSFGPYDGWSVTAFAVGADDKTRLLWRRLDGAAALWTVTTAGAIEAGWVYGPYAGWAATGLTVDGDNWRTYCGKGPTAWRRCGP